jgi:hypothetical protein
MTECLLHNFWSQTLVRFDLTLLKGWEDFHDAPTDLRQGLAVPALRDHAVMSETDERPRPSSQLDQGLDAPTADGHSSRGIGSRPLFPGCLIVSVSQYWPDRTCVSVSRHAET